MVSLLSRPLGREVRHWKRRWEAGFNMIATTTAKKSLVIVHIIWKPLTSDRIDNDRLRTGFLSISTIVAAKWETGSRKNRSFFFQGDRNDYSAREKEEDPHRKRTGLLVGNIFLLLRGTNSKTTHHLLSYVFGSIP